MEPHITIFSSRSTELTKFKGLFETEGFGVSTFSVVNEKNVGEIYRKRPDLILLDLNIENADGIELCYQLKSEKELSSYVALFTDHKEEYIQLEAFKAGADDYIIKPINPRILLKKINALLKRRSLSRQRAKTKLLAYNNLKIDRESYLVFSGEQKFTLPRKEFEILYLFINKPQKTFSREEIFQTVWKENKGTNPRIIDVHIRKIREQIGENTIKTVKGVGYQLA